MQEKEATEHESEKISETFDALVTALEAYFGNVLTQVQKSFEQDTAQEFVVLLADEHLLELPLEAMSIFKKPEIKSLSRDFSLQMFYHRFKQGEPGRHNFYIPVSCLCVCLRAKKIMLRSHEIKNANESTLL